MLSAFVRPLQVGHQDLWQTYKISLPQNGINLLLAFVLAVGLVADVLGQRLIFEVVVEALDERDRSASHAKY